MSVIDELLSTLVNRCRHIAGIILPVFGKYELLKKMFSAALFGREAKFLVSPASGDIFIYFRKIKISFWEE